MEHNPNEPQSLEEMVARYGRALAIIDESTGELKVMGMGGAHSVNFDGKPKPGVKKPKGDGFDPDEDPNNEDEDETQYSEKELKVVKYLDDMSDDDFNSLYPESNDNERAEELKWLFDTAFAFARRALTNRRGRKKKRKYKEESNETEIKAQGPCWPGYKQVGMKKGKGGKMVPNCVPVDGKSLEDECCPDEQEMEVKAAKKKLKDPKGGLTAAGRAHFKRKEGANLKPGVRGAADTPDKMRRKGSFLTRFFTNPSGPMKDEKGRPTRLALSAAAWGEAVPQNASDAAELAAKGRRMLERYGNAKKNKKDAWDDVDVKQLGPTIGGGGDNPNDPNKIDKDQDGVVNDGTPDERPAKRKPTDEKLKNSYLEKRRRRHVKRELKREGITPTRGNQIHTHEYDDGDGKRRLEDHLYGRSNKEKNARSRARASFNQDEDRKRFVRNQLRKQGIEANAKKADRSDKERAARKAARAEYARRVAAGEPRKPKTSSSAPPPKKPDTSWQDNEDRRNQAKKPDTSFQDNEDRRNRGKSPYVPGKPADRYGKPSRQSDGSSQRAEDARNRRKAGPIARNERERQERMRPEDRSNQRVEDARNRGKRRVKPVDRYDKPAPKKPRSFGQGDMV